MKKNNLKKLALMSLAGGMLAAQSQAIAAPQQQRNYQNYTTDATYDMQSKGMTEQELLSQLNSEGRANYMKMDQEGKDLALKLANQSCKGQNDCKGLNSCKTKSNDCAGKGGCKGMSPGPFKDKNQAVKIASQKMADKRSNMMK